MKASKSLLLLPSSPKLAKPRRPISLQRKCIQNPTRRITIKATIEGKDNNERRRRRSMVDEDMIVLRLRIKEMNLLEGDHEVPSHWMEWEKQYYRDYIGHVCEALGLLQNYLMDSRPTLALGIVALLVLSTLISAGVLVSQALEIAKGIVLCGFKLYV